jgi:hypothetical protein
MFQLPVAMLLYFQYSTITCGHHIGCTLLERHRTQRTGVRIDNTSLLVLDIPLLTAGLLHMQ